MRIVYHHRTRATDAQGVHIVEMVNAFRSLGHQVRIAALVDVEKPASPARRPETAPARKSLLGRLPWAAGLIEIGYNLVGLPMVWRQLRDADFLYERYALFNFSGVLAARLAAKPVVLEVNSPLALEECREKSPRLFSLARWAERQILNRATRVIAVSGPLRRILIEQGADPRRIVVLSNGVNPASFRAGAGSPELGRSLGLAGRVVVGFVGWFRPWHGLDLLLEAFRRHGLARRGGALLLIGDGPAMPELESYVAARRLQADVKFTGALPHSEVPAHLDLIDIAVQPAANEYCCPMKILEYMALGKAIVAPRQENIEELVGDREAALFAPGDADSLGEALGRLIDDARARARLGAAARDAIRSRRLLWTENAKVVVGLVGRANARQLAD